MDLVRTAIFTIIVPCSVAGWIPLVLRRYPDASIDLGTPGIAIGSILITIGVIGYVLTAGAFAIIGKGSPSPSHPTSNLIVSGIHRYSRNPMYVSVLSVIIGQAILWGSSNIAIYAVLVWIGFQTFIIFYEEPTLRKKFGEQYETYYNEVPRWIPRIRRKRD